MHAVRNGWGMDQTHIRALAHLRTLSKSMPVVLLNHIWCYSIHIWCSSITYGATQSHMVLLNHTWCYSITCIFYYILYYIFHGCLWVGNLCRSALRWSKQLLALQHHEWKLYALICLCAAVCVHIIIACVLPVCCWCVHNHTCCWCVHNHCLCVAVVYI